MSWNICFPYILSLFSIKSAPCFIAITKASITNYLRELDRPVPNIIKWVNDPYLSPIKIHYMYVRVYIWISCDWILSSRSVTLYHSRQCYNVLAHFRVHCVAQSKHLRDVFRLGVALSRCWVHVFRIISNPTIRQSDKAEISYRHYKSLIILYYSSYIPTRIKNDYNNSIKLHYRGDFDLLINIDGHFQNIAKSKGQHKTTTNATLTSVKLPPGLSVPWTIKFRNDPDSQ